MSKGEKKVAYFNKLKHLLDTYQSIFLVNVDNVGSNQMHMIRKSLRGQAEVLMGKNTMVRRALRNFSADEGGNEGYEKLLSYVKGNIGFVFTNGDLKTIRDIILSNRVQAPARAGAIAPVDVYVPAGNTGMEPGQTSFFQALGIPTKIARGSIEITQDVHLVHVGDKVGPSEATLLNKLNISPFTYGMSVTMIYDNGVIFAPEVLDVTEEDIIKELIDVSTDVACVSLATDYLTIPAVPHILLNTYMDLMAVSVAADYPIESTKEVIELLNDPEAMAAASAAATTSAPAKEEKKDEDEDEDSDEDSDEDMGFGLFD